MSSEYTVRANEIASWSSFTEDMKSAGCPLVTYEGRGPDDDEAGDDKKGGKSKGA